ncbi:TPA: hypothetical protein QBG25_001929, partial [Escherichia coli O174:H8]|nr:hypothetical protein [Escherichia coli O174:H8]
HIGHGRAGVTSGTDAPESHRARTRRSLSAWFAGVCQHGLPESVAVILPLVVAPERDDRHYPAGAVVLAGYVTFTGVM